MTALSNQTKVFITGVTGFIGQRLAQHFVQQGFTVHGIVRKQNPLSAQQQAFLAGVQLHELTDTFAELKELVHAIQPDICFHLATHFQSRHVYEDIPTLIDGNLTFGILLADALAAAQVPYLVNTGTAWQHFEGQAYSPVCLYAAMKQAYEDILRFYAESQPLKIINVKLFDTYGPGDQRRKLIPMLRECALSGAEFLTTDGSQLIDLLYIDDVIAGFQQAWNIVREQTQLMSTYFLASCQPIPVKKVIETYQQVTQQKINIKWNAHPNHNKSMKTAWNMTNILPGWQPHVSLEEGLSKI